jgi:hypothetical protein
VDVSVRETERVFGVITEGRDNREKKYRGLREGDRRTRQKRSSLLTLWVIFE